MPWSSGPLGAGCSTSSGLRHSLSHHFPYFLFFLPRHLPPLCPAPILSLLWLVFPLLYNPIGVLLPYLLALPLLPHPGTPIPCCAASFWFLTKTCTQKSPWPTQEAPACHSWSTFLTPSPFFPTLLLTMLDTLLTLSFQDKQILFSLNFILGNCSPTSAEIEKKSWKEKATFKVSCPCTDGLPRRSSPAPCCP